MFGRSELPPDDRSALYEACSGPGGAVSPAAHPGLANSGAKPAPRRPGDLDSGDACRATTASSRGAVISPRAVISRQGACHREGQGRHQNPSRQERSSGRTLEPAAMACGDLDSGDAPKACLVRKPALARRRPRACWIGLGSWGKGRVQALRPSKGSLANMLKDQDCDPRPLLAEAGPSCLARARDLKILLLVRLLVMYRH